MKIPIINKRYLLFFWLVYSAVSAFADAHKMTFRKYQVNNGLSENSVQCILQDRQGFMWFGTKDGLNKYNGYEFKVFKNDPLNPNSLGNNFIRSLYQDNEGNIWVGTDQRLYILNTQTETFSLFDIKTENGTNINSTITSIVAEDKNTIWIGTATQGVFVYDIQAGKLNQYLKGSDSSTLHSNLIWRIYKDASNTVWIGTRNGLSRYYKETNSFVTYGSRENPEYIDDPEILSIYEDSDGIIWLGTWSGGLVKYNKSTNTFKHYFGKSDKNYVTHIRSILEYRKNELLIGSDDGLYLLNKSTEEYQRLDDQRDPNSLSDQNVYSFYKDKEGGIWIGTYFGGVNYMSANSTIIEHYYPSYKSNSLSGKAVSQFLEDENGNLWIATEDGGLNFFDTKNKSFKTYLSGEKGKFLSYHNLHALTFYRDKLWIGTFSRGLDVLNLEKQTFNNYQYSSTDSATIDDNCVFSLFKSSNNDLYVGTPFGLSKFNSDKNNFERIKQVRGFVYDIIEDYMGNLWIGCYGEGIYRYNRQNQSWTHFVHEHGNPNSLCHNKIIDIYEDEKHRLWFASEGGGLSKYNYDTQDFTTINRSKNLPNDVVYGILDDKYGNIWASTNKGISKINPVTLEISTLTQEDGLQSNQFNYRSSFKASDGKFYFGGINGFNAFYPDQIKDNSYIPPVHITNFELLEVDQPLKADSAFNTDFNIRKKIVLNHDQASFRISFVSLSFQAQEKNQYAYFMENLNTRWVEIGNQRQVSYINLAPGEYTFRVKGSNNNEKWNPKEDFLSVIILPPWWKTKTAYFMYFLLIMGVTYSIFRYYLNIVRLRQRIKLEEFQNEKEKEIYTSKINFFTNIAHEIRTPVSLIRAPLDSILASKEGSAETKENLSVINKNTERLINLVNQLLDFRKIEKDTYSIEVSKVDLNQLITDTCYRFTPAAKKRNIQLSSHIPDKTITIDADKDGITKIISNLITNALKFTNSLITVELETNHVQNKVRVKVSDDGPGIDEQYREKVFEPFYQIDKDIKDDRKFGTGIGLALSKQLVERHKGKIYIESNSKNGCTFIVELNTQLSLPSNDFKEPEKAIDEKEVKQSAAMIDFGSRSQQTIMVVEDNEDLLKFLKNNLKSEFNVLTALNGKIALDIIEENAIDLIVSDIVMPEVGGLELVEKIRSNQQYSHIPIIILSARTNLDTKVDGLDLGAESYIEKPFSIEFLKAQIKSLLANRARLIEKFAQSPFIPYGSIATNKKDEEFIEKLNQDIELHLTDPEYNIESIASTLSMSRSNLQRKIKGLTDMTPNDYVRVYRLKKAANLITSGEYRINEVCYLVGFNSPSYFSKCFKKQFGALPKDFVKDNNQA
ncbi:hybrid sensor histidine kinase/response regulator transcription factor [Carboxylicivirga caseinilyticus]|uniref:hybrid sensor histidine kinase/response regulator transcription factor n=1 Tax=Carboxylicivirga caseinilyticus TaxID=3417572 RepID=UPI003D33D976|nr:response regulator [Marinilabiliaceae bacterium A049]